MDENDGKWAKKESTKLPLPFLTFPLSIINLRPLIFSTWNPLATKSSLAALGEKTLTCPTVSPSLATHLP